MTAAYPITTQQALRADFWNTYPEFKPHRRARKRQNDYNATIRSYWCGFVDCLQKSGCISEALADRAIL